MTAPLLEVSGLAKHYPIRKGIVLARQIGAVRAVDHRQVGEAGAGKAGEMHWARSLSESSSC